MLDCDNTSFPIHLHIDGPKDWVQDKNSLFAPVKRHKILRNVIEVRDDVVINQLKPEESQDYGQEQPNQ